MVLDYGNCVERVRGYLVTGMEGKPISAICYVQHELELGGGKFSRRSSNNSKNDADDQDLHGRLI